MSSKQKVHQKQKHETQKQSAKMEIQKPIQKPIQKRTQNKIQKRTQKQQIQSEIPQDINSINNIRELTQIVFNNLPTNYERFSPPNDLSVRGTITGDYTLNFSTSRNYTNPSNYIISDTIFKQPIIRKNILVEDIVYNFCVMTTTTPLHAFVLGVKTDSLFGIGTSVFNLFIPYSFILSAFSCTKIENRIAFSVYPIHGDAENMKISIAIAKYVLYLLSDTYLEYILNTPTQNAFKILPHHTQLKHICDNQILYDLKAQLTIPSGSVNKKGGKVTKTDLCKYLETDDCSISGIKYSILELIKITNEHYNKFVEFIKLHKDNAWTKQFYSVISKKTLFLTNLENNIIDHPTEMCNIIGAFIYENLDYVLEQMFDNKWIKGNFTDTNMLKKSTEIHDTQQFFVSLIYRFTVLADYLTTVYNTQTTAYTHSSIYRILKVISDVGVGLSGITTLANIGNRQNTGTMVIVKTPRRDYRDFGQKARIDNPLYEIKIHTELNKIRLLNIIPNIPFMFGYIFCNMDKNDAEYDPNNGKVTKIKNYCSPFSMRPDITDVSIGKMYKGIYIYKTSIEIPTLLDGCDNNLRATIPVPISKNIPVSENVRGCKVIAEPINMTYHALTERVVTDISTQKTQSIFNIMKTCSEETAFSLIVQMLFALELLTDTVGFLHNDLHGNNILVQQMPLTEQSIVFKYYIPTRAGKPKIYGIRIKDRGFLTDGYIPMIIDFGRCSIQNNFALDIAVSEETKKLRIDAPFIHNFHPTIDVFQMLQSILTAVQASQTKPIITEIITKILTDADIAKNVYIWIKEYILYTARVCNIPIRCCASIRISPIFLSTSCNKTIIYCK